MNKKNYVYKVKRPYLKKEWLLKEGFNLYESDLEKDGEIIYAIPIKLDINSPIPQGTIRVLEDEKFLAEANLDELEKAGIYYKEDSLIYDTKGIVVSAKFDADRSDTDEFLTAQLCVGYRTGDFTEGMLFLNDSSKVPYYNIEVLNQHCYNFIEVLLEKGIIYKKLVKED